MRQKAEVEAYDAPALAGYHPELNELVPLWHFAGSSKVPAAKSVPVRRSKEKVLELIEDNEIPLAAT